MRRFRIYVEGSGDTNKLQSVGREALKKFLSEIIPESSFAVEMCGGRKQAFNDFCLAVNKPRSGEFPLLLIDAEAVMQEEGKPWRHLKVRVQDGWDKPQNATDDHAFLMVQTMEAWLVCDHSAWKKWKARVDVRKLPVIHNGDVESVEKIMLEKGCEAACKPADSSYMKNKRLSGFGILKHVQASLVRKNSKEAERFFKFLEGKGSAK